MQIRESILDTEYGIKGIVRWLELNREDFWDYCPFDVGLLPNRATLSPDAEYYCSACERLFPGFTTLYYLLRKYSSILPPEYPEGVKRESTAFLPYYRCPCEHYTREQVKEHFRAYLRSQGWRRRGVFFLSGMAFFAHKELVGAALAEATEVASFDVPNRDVKGFVADHPHFSWADTAESPPRYTLVLLCPKGCHSGEGHWKFVKMERNVEGFWETVREGVEK